jgi:hypothetical protein
MASTGIAASDPFYHHKQRYDKFIKKTPFKGGLVSTQLSGKSSFMRLNCLGATVNGIRGTLIVDESLTPTQIGINRILFDTLNLAIPFIYLNRDPSINSRCIYICEIVPYDNPDDFTIKINQYTLKGLHGDQDGDELNLYYMQYEHQAPTHNMVQSVYETHRKSWKYGFRHDILGRSRYSFSQHQDLMVYIYNNELCKLSPLWNSLQPFEDRNDMIFELGCYTHRQEIDEFLDILSKFSLVNSPGLSTYSDMINGVGIIADIVASKSKGSDAHTEEYLKKLNAYDEAELFQESVSTFNKYVASNANMKICGRQNFCLLHIYQNIFLLQTDLFMNDTVIIHNFVHHPLISRNICRPHVVKYHFNQLLAGLYD